MENTSDSFMPRPLLFCLKSGRSVCYSVPDNKEAISHIRDKLAELVGCELCQSEQEELRTFITEKTNDSRIRTQKGKRLLGKKAINELLQEYNMPFQIEGIYGKRKGDETFWVVKRREK